ncbi:MAG TPA: hypothetical protein VML54_07475 [Candidatus Limnocylindrales bacterium]|nr:hypothetical protein [Candidatus Limnocylindrales bacterium]
MSGSTGGGGRPTGAITRRTLLVGIGGFAGFVLGACRRRSADSGRSAVPDARLDPAVAKIRDEVEASLPFLPLERGEVENFALAYVLHRDAGTLTPALELDLQRRFLLSTDFFDHGADLQRTPRYVLFYDPWATPCSNRLAQRPADPRRRRDGSRW